MVFSYAFFVGISRSTAGGCGMQHTGAGTARMASMASYNHFPPPSPRPLHLLVLLHTVAFYSLSIGLFMLSRLDFFLYFLFVCLFNCQQSANRLALFRTTANLRRLANVKAATATATKTTNAAAIEQQQQQQI